MDEEGQDWVTLHRASREVGVPVTTIRDWFRGGVIDSTVGADGQRLVLLSQAMQQATGLGSERSRRAAQRPARTPEQLEAEVEAIAERTRAVSELQEVARERQAGKQPKAPPD